MMSESLPDGIVLALFKQELATIDQHPQLFATAASPADRVGSAIA
jgi:hypothetical protein